MGEESQTSDSLDMSSQSTKEPKHGFLYYLFWYFVVFVIIYISYYVAYLNKVSAFVVAFVSLTSWSVLFYSLRKQRRRKVIRDWLIVLIILAAIGSNYKRKSDVGEKVLADLRDSNEMIDSVLSLYESGAVSEEALVSTDSAEAIYKTYFPQYWRKALPVVENMYLYQASTGAMMSCLFLGILAIPLGIRQRSKQKRNGSFDQTIVIGPDVSEPEKAFSIKKKESWNEFFVRSRKIAEVFRRRKPREIDGLKQKMEPQLGEEQPQIQGKILPTTKPLETIIETNEPDETIECSNCGNLSPIAHVMCTNCGKKLRFVRCSSCGSELEDGFKILPEMWREHSL